MEYLFNYCASQGDCWTRVLQKMGSGFDLLGAILKPSYLGKVFDKAGEGGNFQHEGGALLATGLGYKSSTGVGVDSNGKCAVVLTNCGLVGPTVGREVYAGGSLGTGSFKSGDTSWSVGVLGTWTNGLGVLKNLQFANDGGIQYGGAEAAGLAIGAAIQVCRQQVVATGCK